MARSFVRQALTALLLVFAFALAAAQPVLPVPALSARVIDQTGTLGAEQQQALESKLAAFEARKGTQIVVLMVPTTQPEDIASYANRVANTWKIGRRDVGDGLLVIVAKDDRRMRIEVAKTLEGAVPDIAAGRIIDQAMKPRFRQNDFAGGIDAALDQVIARIDGEALPEVDPHPAPRAQGGDIDWGDLGIFLFFGVLLVGGLARKIFGNKLGPLVTGAGAGLLAFVLTASLGLAIFAAIIALILVLFSGIFSALPFGGGGRGGGGWSGGGGWGGGSGGGGWGGGGDFGGGGASGDW